MAKTSVEQRTFTNEAGDIIKYNVIVIRGSINGKEQTYEKSIPRNDAMLVGMLLDSDEDLQVTVRKGGAKKSDEGYEI